MANKFYNHTVSDYYGQPALAEPDQFGIEIEMEGLPEAGLVFPRVAGWTPQADGSLRNGIEFVSAGPRTIDQLTTDLPNLSQAFAGINFVPVFSYRTSLHVHANVRDLTWVQIANLWAIYTIFEMPLMEMGGEERIGNVHCQAVTDCHEVVDRFKRCFDDKAGKGGVFGGAAPFDFNNHVQRLTNRDRRYASFNFASIPNFGTVEFRSHRGTMDTKTVLDWVQTIMAMKAAARVYPDPQWLVQDFSSKGPQGFAEHVFGPDHYVTQNINQFNTDVWEGLRLAQEVAFVRPAWDKAAKPAKKAKPEPEVQPVAADNQRPHDYEMMPQIIRNRVNDNITLLNEINRMGNMGQLVPDWIDNDYDRNLRAIAEWRNGQAAVAPAEPADLGRQRRARNATAAELLAQIGRAQNPVPLPAGWAQWDGNIPQWAMRAEPLPVEQPAHVLDDDDDEDFNADFIEDEDDI